MSYARLLPLWLVSLMAIVYVLLVGPANFLLLRRWRKPLLFVAAVPVIVVAYSGMIFVTGYLYKGTSNRYSELEIVEATSGSAEGASDRYMGIFSASPSGFKLDYDARHLPYPFFANATKQQDAKIRFSNYPTIAIDQIPLDMWEMGYMGTRGPRDLSGGVHLTADESTKEITNNTPQDLAKGIVAFKTTAGNLEYYAAPPVEQGETVVLDLSQARPIPVRAPYALPAHLKFPDGDELREYIGTRIFERLTSVEQKVENGGAVLLTTFEDDTLPFETTASMEKEFAARFLIVRSLNKTMFNR
jgi:hypothetical protein